MKISRVIVVSHFRSVKSILRKLDRLLLPPDIHFYGLLLHDEQNIKQRSEAKPEKKGKQSKGGRNKRTNQVFLKCAFFVFFSIIYSLQAIFRPCHSIIREINIKLFHENRVLQQLFQHTQAHTHTHKEDRTRGITKKIPRPRSRSKKC